MSDQTRDPGRHHAQDARDVERVHALAVRLRGDPAQVNPPGWEAELADAPWPVKVYRGGRRWALGGAGPDWLPGASADPLGRLLHLSAGVTAVRYAPGGVHLSSPERPTQRLPERRLQVRRAVPSGGGMYPTEVYLVACAPVGSGAGRLPPGAYHYDPAGHELVSLGVVSPGPEPARELAGELGAALRLHPRTPVPAAVLVLASRFWKNAHKYGDFSYRLGAVDLGVVLGRLLRLADAGASVHPGFDDDRLDRLLGLDGRAEASYAALALPGAGTVPVTTRTSHPPRPAPPPVLERSGRARTSAEFAAAHAAARRAGRRLDTYHQPPSASSHAPADPAPAAVSPDPGPEAGADRLVPLPDPEPPRLGLAEAVTRRSSAGTRFTGAPVRAAQLAAILAAAVEALHTLRECWYGPEPPRLGLACAVSAVEGIEPGFALVRADARALVPVRPPADPPAQPSAQPGGALWAALHLRTLNPELAAVTVHITGVLDLRASDWGARAYRLQQIAVGVVMDAVALRCAELGLGAHPLLGVDAHALDRHYRLPGTGSGVLAQICVGHTRPGLAVEGPVTTLPVIRRS